MGFFDDEKDKKDNSQGGYQGYVPPGQGEYQNQNNPGVIPESGGIQNAPLSQDKPASEPLKSNQDAKIGGVQFTENNQGQGFVPPQQNSAGRSFAQTGQNTGYYALPKQDNPAGGYYAPPQQNGQNQGYYQPRPGNYNPYANGYGNTYGSPYANNPEADNYGVTAMILGVISLALCSICAFFALSYANKQNAVMPNGFSRAGKVFGILGVILFFVKIILAIVYFSIIASTRYYY